MVHLLYSEIPFFARNFSAADFGKKNQGNQNRKKVQFLKTRKENTKAYYERKQTFFYHTADPVCLIFRKNHFANAMEYSSTVQWIYGQKIEDSLNKTAYCRFGNEIIKQ